MNGSFYLNIFIKIEDVEGNLGFKRYIFVYQYVCLIFFLKMFCDNLYKVKNKYFLCFQKIYDFYYFFLYFRIGGFSIFICSRVLIRKQVYIWWYYFFYIDF